MAGEAFDARDRHHHPRPAGEAVRRPAPPVARPLPAARAWVASAAWCSRQIDAICGSKPSIGRPARSRPDTIVA